MVCQHFPDDQTLRLQTGAGEDDIIHLPSGLDRVECERQEEEEETCIGILSSLLFYAVLFDSILLLLLRSPALSLGFTILGEILAYVTVYNPKIKVVTFRLRGWCMLGVFLLPAFTHLGHERQDLLSPCDGMHVSTD